jgi:hypothetical protein
VVAEEVAARENSVAYDRTCTPGIRSPAADLHTT